MCAGAFWYELAGFAHKPLTDFLATAPLLGLLALSVRPRIDRPRVVWQATGLAVLAAAIRMQYAPVAVVLLGIVLVRTPRERRCGSPGGCRRAPRSRAGRWERPGRCSRWCRAPAC